MINTIAVVAVAAGAFVFALHQIRKHFLAPLWKLFKNIVAWSEAHSTLMTIADEFKPNAGSSLVDRVSRVEDAATASNRGVEELKRDFASLSNLLRQHIIDSRVGGNRRTDPKER